MSREKPNYFKDNNYSKTMHVKKCLDRENKSIS